MSTCIKLYHIHQNASFQSNAAYGTMCTYVYRYNVYYNVVCMHTCTSSVRDTIDTVEIDALTVRRRNITVWYIVGASNPVKRTLYSSRKWALQLAVRPTTTCLNVIECNFRRGGVAVGRRLLRTQRKCVHTGISRRSDLWPPRATTPHRT